MPLYCLHRTFVDIVKLLVTKNPPINLKNKKDEDPVSIAKANKMFIGLYEIYSKICDLQNAISSIENAITQDGSNIDLYYNYAIDLSKRAAIEKEGNKLEEAKKSYQDSQENLKRIVEKQPDYKDLKNIRMNNDEEIKIIDNIINTQKAEIQNKLREAEAKAKTKELEDKKILFETKAKELEAKIKDLEVRSKALEVREERAMLFVN